MATLSYPTTLSRQLSIPVARPKAMYSGIRTSLAVVLKNRDYRFFADTSGTIAANNRVMVKAGPDAPETPMPGARVRLHRAADGYCAWHGISDAAGYYHASGLEVGLTYIPVAIDLSGTYECVAAGPVIAVKADA